MAQWESEGWQSIADILFWRLEGEAVDYKHKKKIESFSRLKIRIKIFAKTLAFVPAGNGVFVFTRSIICRLG